MQHIQVLCYTYKAVSMKEKAMNMKKNTKKTSNTNVNNVNSHSRFGIQLPVMTSMDDLAYMSEDELSQHHDQLLSEKENVARYDLDVRPWEIELCYAQRELKIRTTRRAAHDRFVRTHPDAVERNSSDNDNFETFN
jgi:hypothetical protein